MLTHRKSSGTAITMGLWGELEEGATLSCCHCQFTRILKKGSGQTWHWCAGCAAYHCGGVDCRECVPLGRRIDNMEAGRHVLTTMPTTILVPAGVDLLKG